MGGPMAMAQLAMTVLTDDSGRVATVSTIRRSHDWETMVFPGASGESWHDVDSDHYSSEQDARDGHAVMVGRVALALADGQFPTDRGCADCDYWALDLSDYAEHRALNHA